MKSDLCHLLPKLLVFYNWDEVFYFAQYINDKYIIAQLMRNIWYVSTIKI